MNPSAAKNVRWDLSDLYTSAEDTRISADLGKALHDAREFEKKYKQRFDTFERTGNQNALDLVGLIADYKLIVTDVTRIIVFARLSFAEQTNDAARGAFLQKIQEKITLIQTHLLFWNVRWSKLDADTVEKLLSSDAMAENRHYLEDMRKFAPHTLTEPEEKIMSLKMNTSRGAFVRLFDETVNRIEFTMEVHGKREQKTETEVLSLLHSQDREVRKQASFSLSRGLADHAKLLTYIFNMVLADHRVDMQLRHYKHPMDSRNLANETDLDSVLNLVKSVKCAYPLVHRYYKLKKRLLGVSEMFDYDRYASVSAVQERVIDFSECQKIVVDGYAAFCPEAADIAKQFFDKKWIDAEVRAGKQGGGFCCATTPALHPYVLVNYTGTTRDVMVVAHELGHGIHQYLARRSGILEMSAPLTMAETASVFGEMLIFEKILGDEKDKSKRLALICGKIDDNFATVFRQIAMTDFELRAHEAGLQEGELAEEKLNEFWIGANRDLYGDSVTLTSEYRHGWKYIPHFVHTPFYCYAYSYAQLFVLALFRKYKENPKSFIPRYLEMLALGGSKRPEELARTLDLNLLDPHFWQTGIQLLEDLVAEAEKLAG